MEIRQCCRTSNGSATVVQIPMEVRQLSKRQWKFDIVQIQILEFWLSKFYGTNGTSVGYETRYFSFKDNSISCSKCNSPRVWQRMKELCCCLMATQIAMQRKHTNRE